MNWRSFAAAAPGLSAKVLDEFRRPGVALIGTLRADGSPRISSVDPILFGDDLVIGIMWRSLKARDLLRDSRLILHNAIHTNTGSEREVSLRGRAVAIDDEDVRARFAASVETPWREPFHLFVVDIESAALVEYGGGRQKVTVWPSGKRLDRPY